MKTWKRVLVILAVILAVLVMADVTLAQGTISRQTFRWVVARILTVQGDTNLQGETTMEDAVVIAGPTAIGTATPLVIIQNSGVSNPLEVRNSSGTPIAAVQDDGAVVFAGSITSAGAVNGGGVLGASFAVAPTAVATNTPVFYINSATGNTANLTEWRIANTPIASVGAAGGAAFTALTSSGGVTSSGGPFKHTAPTAVGTATPGAVFDTSGVSNILEARKAATPVFVIGGSGNTSVSGTLGSAGAVTVGTDGAGADVTFHSGTSGDLFLWDASEEALVLTGTNGQTALSVADGNVSITDNLSVTGTTALASDVTLSGLSNGNNALAKNEYIGLPRIKLVGLGGGTNPGSQTIAWMDATPAGEWAEVDAGTNLAVTADTTYYRDVTNSVKLAFTDVVDNDGVDGTVTEVNLTDMESLGFWIYSETEIQSGDFDVTLDDTDGTDQVYSVGAVSANTWTWVELDISACDANCNTVDGVKFLATAQGGTALTAANVYLDAMYVWDAADEEALGVAIQRDGVLGVINAAAGTSLVEWTDYIVHEESGVDFIVWITDQSTAFPFCLVAY